MNYKSMQKQQPLVSVMIPVYNGEKTIRLAIKSLLAQTYKNWMCVIINDGSTDDTEVILDRIYDQRFKIIHLGENIGRGGARQIALNNAQGKYLAYLDADDLYHPIKLENQVKYLEMNSDVSLVSCGQGSFDIQYDLKAIRGKGLNKKTAFDPNIGINGSYAGCMIRLFEGKGTKYNIRLKASEDRDYFERCLDSKTICVSDEVLYYHSEIGKTTSHKILFYQLEALKVNFYSINDSFMLSSIRILKRIIKIIIYSIILPFTGADFILKRRGEIPLKEEFEEFSKVCALLNI